MVVAAAGDNDLLLESAERAGDQEQAIDPAPCHAAQQEGPDIFKGLRPGKEAFGQTDLFQPAIFDHAGIRDPDDSAGSDDPGALSPRGKACAIFSSGASCSRMQSTSMQTI